jgi:hypothetical protein
LSDLDHEALEAKHAPVDATCALLMMAAYAAVVRIFRHSSLSHLEGLVAKEDTGGYTAGVAEADDPYVTQLSNGHRQ